MTDNYEAARTRYFDEIKIDSAIMEKRAAQMHLLNNLLEAALVITAILLLILRCR